MTAAMRARCAASGIVVAVVAAAVNASSFEGAGRRQLVHSGVLSISVAR